MLFSRILAVVALFLPLVAAAPTPVSFAAPVDVSLPVFGNFTTQDSFATLAELVSSGKVNFCGADLEKRRDVPGLHCGFARATRCALSTSGVLATCVWAAISLGRDIKEDSKCAASIVALGANLPRDCKLCFGMAV
ncbi:hypothetical protein M427DRAFT_38824 [Gonapodya prolifera JEL478]|uniref:Fungal calcium binding protein domain-containing protein n=1 Tax=Gonapodya prolifera (strain JEL478) TaxID=1344416 RepID=A0A138ZYA6_GONPJ|nr:hypothetical protein M427DRAFT_38823 [Gonapodya prolifera JEL478]KXS09493.1 hypothetical protein M427DRAFT_38824 [Gonapodya prolifera JEL478]|eukprot:KXS09492.1 hypothetical protein M427DRAFT_38823 [Gonapodya prolifera JEL478]